MGASRSLPLPHSLKGKPVIVRLAAASSAALPSFPSVLPPEGDRPGIRSGCGWEGSPSFPQNFKVKACAQEFQRPQDMYLI
jgi:hypothetical protein